MRRHAHDRTFAVTHEHVIADPHGHRLTGQRMAHDQPRRHSLLFLSRELRFDRRSTPALVDERSQHGVASRRVSRQRMLRRYCTKRDAHDGVGAGRECMHHACVVTDCVWESDAHTLALADPIGLHGTHALRPSVHLVQGFEQILGVGRDLQVIHGNLAFFDQRARAPATAIDHLLIGKNRLVDRIPIHHAGLLIGDAFFQHAQEQPLIPAVVVRPAGRQFAAPIQGEP